MDDLRKCPFCGHTGIHMRKKTHMRESITGFKYVATEPHYHPLTYGQDGTIQHERNCYDYRFGIRFYCGKCHISPPYIWGEWHLPTKEEAEEFDDLPHACERFDPQQEMETIDKAKSIWNRRAE